MPEENLGVAASTPQVDASSTVTPDVNAAQGTTTASTVATPEVTNTPAGQSASTDTITPAVSAPAEPADDFKTPPELRRAYNEVVARLKPNEELLGIIEERGGAAYVQQANDIYDSFVGPNANPENFLNSLYEISPLAYETTMRSLVDANREVITSQLFGQPVTADDWKAFQTFKQTGQTAQTSNQASSQSADTFEVPEFDEETGEPIPKSVQNMMRAQMAQLSQFTATERARTEAAQRAEAEKRETAIEQSISSFRNDRIKVISNTIDKMGLADSADDTPESKADKALLRQVIQATAMSAFGQDEKSKSIYVRAMQHLEAGEEKPAQALSFQIEAQLARHASQVASRISQLLDAERKLKTQTVQQAASGERPEVTSTGAAPQVGIAPANNFAPFSDQSIQARLEQLRASGVIKR
jgi:hypothetical protein